MYGIGRKYTSPFVGPFITEGLKFNYKDLDLKLLNDIDFVNMDNTKTVYLYQIARVNANQK